MLVLLAAGLCIYGQTLDYPFIIFDDPGYVTQNAHVNQGLTWAGWKWAWTSFERSNWHPLTWLSLMLDAQMYGLNAGGYHLTNLLLHELNGVLIFVWLRTATGAFWPSALTGFFFVAHPLHVESVAWITERKDVLSTLFFCLTLLAYTRYASDRGRRFYWLAVGFFALGLTAKPMLVTVPPLLLLLDYWPLRRLQIFSWRRLLLEKVPFFLLAAAVSVVTIIAQRSHAMVPLESLPGSQRAAAATLSYGAYLTKTMLPLNLGVYYPYWRSQSMTQPVCWAMCLGGFTLVAFLVRRASPFVLVGWCWFLGTLVPVIGVVQVGGQAFADRYTYLPHMGLFIGVFWAGAAAWGRWGRVTRVSLAVLTALAAMAAVGLSYRQAGYWRTSATLFEQTVGAVQPTARLYCLLGNAEIEGNRTEKARDAYLQAWRMGTTGDEIMTPLGTLLLNAGRWREAADVLAPAKDRPTATADLLNNLALALAKDGRNDEAQAAYQHCVERFPDFALVRFGWAEMLQRRGWVGDAMAQDEAGLALRGDWLPAILRLSWNYAHLSEPRAHEGSLVLAQQAVKISGGREPGSLNVLAYAEAVNGKWEAATETATRALEAALQPNIPGDVIEGYRTRLDCYRRRQLPP